MKTTPLIKFAGLIVLAVHSGPAAAQTLQPVNFNVTTSFTNPAGAVRTRLLDLSGPGMIVYAVGGRTTEASPRVAATPNPPPAASSRTSSSAALTVDAAGSPQWNITTTAWLDEYGQQFYSGPSAPVAVAPGGGPYVVNFDRSVSIVDVNFGAPVTGGTILISKPDRTITYGQATPPAGTSRSELVVPGGLPVLIELALETGSGGEAGTTRRVVRRIETWMGAGGVPDNTIQTVNLNLNDGATLGSFTGNFDVVGAEVLSVPNAGPAWYGWSLMTASYFSTALPGYAGWRRVSVINNAGSATGAFTLGNLTSSASIAANDPGTSGYGLQGTALLRRTLPSGGKGVQYFRTRQTLHGELPPVPAGGAADLGNRFVMSPATVRGTLQLCGPAAQPGQPALLSRILTAADSDSNNDGLPEGALALDTVAWWYQSGIFTNTAVNNNSGYGGTGWQIMERTYAAPDALCEYDIAVASPNDEAASWTAPGVSMVMKNGSPLENEYFDTVWSAQRRGAATFAGTPGAVHTLSDTMNTGEVTIIVRSASAGVNVWQPRLASQENALTQDAGNAWNVESMVAYGWPAASAGATTRASLRTLLPSGVYTLRPTVQTTNGTTSMAPFTITVPSRGRITVDNGLTVAATVPPCISPVGGMVNGSVNSGGVPVTSITWSIDGEPAQNATFTLGPNPSYSFAIGLLPAGPHTVTVTVSTSDGRTSSVTYNFHVDTTPPSIAPIADVVVSNAPIGGEYVSFPAPVVSDDCGPVTISCNPPPGSLFPIGTTVVTCTALDQAGNSNARTFNVIVRQACPPPVRSHYFSGNEDCWFRHQDNPQFYSSIPMSISAWVKRTDAGRCETIVSHNYINSFWFGFCPKLRFYRSGGSFADADIDVPANQWTHVGVSYDGTDARFYINGVPAGTKPLSHSAVPAPPAPLYIGSDFSEGSSQYRFRGWLDEVLIFYAALSSSDFEPYFTGRVRRPQPEVVLASAFGTGGSEEYYSNLPAVSGPEAPQPMIEGVLPKYSVAPRTRHTVTMDGVINTGTEYSGADKMVILYTAGPTIADAVAHMVWREEPGDEALYIGVTGLRDVIAPWTRDKSFVGIYFLPEIDPNGDPLATAKAFRYCRRLDGSNGPGFAPTGFERGNGAGNFTALAPGDPLISAPSPFGLLGAGGTSMEFRFDRSVFGSAWKKNMRISINHHWLSGVGDDADAPVLAAFEVPDTWGDLVFGGQAPELQYERFVQNLHFTWVDPCGEFTLQRSSTMLPGSWMPVTSQRLMGLRDGLFGFVDEDMSLAPRMFYRLTRP